MNGSKNTKHWKAVEELLKVLNMAKNDQAF